MPFCKIRSAYIGIIEQPGNNGLQGAADKTLCYSLITISGIPINQDITGQMSSQSLQRSGPYFKSLLLIDLLAFMYLYFISCNIQYIYPSSLLNFNVQCAPKMVASRMYDRGFISLLCQWFKIIGYIVDLRDAIRIFFTIQHTITFGTIKLNEIKFTLLQIIWNTFWKITKVSFAHFFHYIIINNIPLLDIYIDRLEGCGLCTKLGHSGIFI